MLESLPKGFDKKQITVLGLHRCRRNSVIRVPKADYAYMERCGFHGYFALAKGRYANSAPREAVAETALKTGEPVRIVKIARPNACVDVNVKAAFLDGNYVVLKIERA